MAFVPISITQDGCRLLLNDANGDPVFTFSLATTVALQLRCDRTQIKDGNGSSTIIDDAVLLALGHDYNSINALANACGVSASSGAGPYTVAYETPSPGLATVTDTGSGNSFILTLSYKQDFIIADWVAGAGGDTLTIAAATHGMGSQPTVQIYEGTEQVVVDTIDVSATGDVTLTVVPTGTGFDGKIIISR